MPDRAGRAWPGRGLPRGAGRIRPGGRRWSRCAVRELWSVACSTLPRPSTVSAWLAPLLPSRWPVRAGRRHASCWALVRGWCSRPNGPRSRGVGDTTGPASQHHPRQAAAPHTPPATTVRGNSRMGWPRASTSPVWTRLLPQPVAVVPYPTGGQHLQLAGTGVELGRAHSAPAGDGFGDGFGGEGEQPTGICRVAANHSPPRCMRMSDWWSTPPCISTFSRRLSGPSTVLNAPAIPRCVGPDANPT